MSTRPTTPDILGAVMAGEPKTERLELARIKINGGTQMRAGLNADTVAEYADAMRDNGWGEFPAVIVYYDGTTYWLADGFHRLAAWRMIGVAVSDTRVPAIVKAGDQRAAILHAAGANANHGLRRTNDDKRRAVEVLLRDAEWSQWSNYEIAKRCAVDEKTVRNIRGKMELSTENPQIDATRTVRRGDQIYQQNTANIGTNRPEPAPAQTAKQPEFASVWQLESIVRQVWSQLNAADDPKLDQQIARAARGDAAAKAGTFWGQCKAAMGDDILAYRHSDLQQAINNVANQKQARAASKLEAQQWRPPGMREPFVPDKHHPEPGVYIPPTREEFANRPKVTSLLDLQPTVDMCWDLQYGKDVEPTVMRANIKTARFEAEQQGHFFNFCHDSADDELRPFTDNTLRMAIVIYCDKLDANLMQTNPELYPPVPMYSDDLPADDPDALEDDADFGISEDDDDDLATAERTAGNLLRLQQIEDLRDRLSNAIAAVKEAGDLTGRYTATLGAERELRHVIQLLDNEAEALAKGTNHEYA